MSAPLDPTIAWAVLLTIFVWSGLITWKNRDR